ncbi:MAG: 50S ribosomal protein L9 [Actinomycetota bacterium]
MMRIILRRDVSGVGTTGEVIEVADGYAQNYLIPQGMAMRASDGAIAQAATMKRARDARDAEQRAAAEEVARTLVPKVITVSAKAGAGGKLYGSVTTSDVAHAVEAQAGIELDRRVLSLDEPIRELGSHSVAARLHDDVRFQIQVEVVAL